MRNKLLIFAIFTVIATLVLNSIATALIYDFVGADAKKWFEEFVNGDDTTIGGGDAGWELTKDGLTTDNTLPSGHQRIGFSADWTDYTVEAEFKFLIFGTYNESQLYVRWQDEPNNYFFRTIARNNAGTVGPWSIEWLRKVVGTDNEGDITDNVNVIANLEKDTIYGLRGTIENQLLTVEFFNGKEWLEAGEVTYPGTYETGGIGVGRSSCQVAWQYIRVNGSGIPADSLSVESLGKLATTWAAIK